MPPGNLAEAPGRAPHLLLAAGMAFLTVYAGSLLFPPPAAPLRPPALDASLMARLFPALPAWWIIARLACLGAGMVLIALSVCVTGDLPSAPAASRRRVAMPVQLLALLLAAAQALAAWWAADLDRHGQLAYVACLALPALVLTLGSRRSPDERPATGGRASIAATAAIICAWGVFRYLHGLHAPRSADLVDTWVAIPYLEWAARPGFNILTDGFLPGLTALHLITVGGGILGTHGLPIEVSWIQALEIGWVGLSAALIAWLARALLGSGRAAPLAAAAFLFAPAVLMMPLAPIPYCVGPLFTAIVLVPLLAVHRDRSVPALAVLGVTAGIACTEFFQVPVAVLALPLCAWTALRRPRLPPLALAIAALSFLAVVLPALGRAADLPGMIFRYAQPAWQWTMIEAAMLGQVTHLVSEITNEFFRLGRLDVPLGALLAPFAIPRTPSRLQGDALFDPLGLVLAAVAVAGCLRGLRGSNRARALILFLGVALGPALLTSTYDRTSLNRLAQLPVAMALLAATGFEILAALAYPLRRGLAAGLAVAAIAAGGTLLFEVVNLRTLPASWLDIAFEAMQRRPPPGGALILEPSIPKRSFMWLYTRQIAAHLGAAPVPVLAYEGPGSLPASAAPPGAVFWSPAHEQLSEVSAGVCRRWPAATLYTFTGAARISEVYAAAPAKAGWKPAMPEARQRAASCAEFASAREGARRRAAVQARTAIDRARELAADGRSGAAVAVLRLAARQVTTEPDLFEATARTLLSLHELSPQKAEEAMRWAQRACELTGYADPVRLRTLAAACAAAGRFEEAARMARQGRDAAAGRGQTALAADLQAQAQQYEQLGSVSQ